MYVRNRDQGGAASSLYDFTRVMRDGDLPERDGPTGPTPDANANQERAGRRARGRLRRYVVANRCSRLLTLTCADQTHDRAVMVRRVQAFARGLTLGRPQLAYAWVLERHKSGALHAHLVLSEFVDYRAIRRLWGHGIIDVRKIRSPRRGQREASRSAARYLAKYVTKDPVAGPGQHRYDVREGRQPVAVRLVLAQREAAVAWAIGSMGGEVPSYRWESDECKDWTGPPVTFLGW